MSLARGARSTSVVAVAVVAALGVGATFGRCSAREPISAAVSVTTESPVPEVDALDPLPNPLERWPRRAGARADDLEVDPTTTVTIDGFGTLRIASIERIGRLRPPEPPLPSDPLPPDPNDPRADPDPMAFTPVGVDDRSAGLRIRLELDREGSNDGITPPTRAPAITPAERDALFDRSPAFACTLTSVRDGRTWTSHRHDESFAAATFVFAVGPVEGPFDLRCDMYPGLWVMYGDEVSRVWRIDG